MKVLEVISRISELDDLREVDVLIPKVLHYLKFGKGPFEPLVQFHHDLFILRLLVDVKSFEDPIIEVESQKFQGEDDLGVFPLFETV